MIRDLAINLIYYSGIGNFLYSRNLQKGKFPVLVFHRVSDKKDEYWQPLSIRSFENIIRFLNNKYTFISLQDIVSKRSKLPDNACAITFDDGYQDFYDNALPVIKKFKVPVTLFTPANCIEKQELIWSLQINDLLRNTSEKYFDVPINKVIYQFDLTTDEGKIESATELLKILKQVSDVEVDNVMKILRDKLGNSNIHSIQMMTKDQIREISDFVDIQSHSLAHPFLPNIESDYDLENEINSSSKRISAITGKDINLFAYPMGGYNERVIDVARKNYELAFSVDEELVDIHQLNNENYNYRIPRFNIHNENPKEVFLRINGFHTKIKKMFS